MRHLRSALSFALAAGLACPLAAQPSGQSIALAGMLGSKALLVVDGGEPRAVGPGETHQGVKVLSVTRDEATVEVQGIRRLLRLGESPVALGSSGSGKRVVLMADNQGHFVNNGFINGKPMKYMVDTGASVVAVGKPDAERMGIKVDDKMKVVMATANGVAEGWRVRLKSVRLGDVELLDVEGVVMPTGMPFVLLGNSFLTQFQMTRNNDQMVLEKRH
ncbi:clan AA aspartic protease, TIGR02281 family [Acidovorax sp. CF316]|uniref:retropepsin-like aspartic protease family protein n=1 Tax=Acidovorax sp. CF316 TaxID=1144317 RepID=UPI00026BC3AB|nr:retropepsin-like aspartic protease [Acidovorax sp. CF316]EJE50758.1 clan AA aspartic protease, TIGR02281 family [Acidovorax sp. CF316]